MKEEDLKPSSSNNLEANSDFKPVLHGNTECDLDENARFDKSLLELKELSSQLHYAAKYCENSFLKSKEKKMVMENTKEYICRALVTVVDHLGSVSANLESQLLGKQQFFDSEHRMICLQQRLSTCQEYTQKLTLSRLCQSDNLRKHHTRYISLPTSDIEKSSNVSREVDDSLDPKTTLKYSLDATKEIPLFLYANAQKPLLTKLSESDVNCAKKFSIELSSAGLKFPAVLPIRDTFLISIPRNPSFHFQETKKLGRKEQNRKSLQLPWRKSHKIHQGVTT
ncbi:Abil1 [Thalictrum thalictroides]|uniref:Abil1 n=1 Tax=Thalictrum thalictroides TaxID=46969 RepID=A0A7J6VG38_THATH|nr:Abil1 [Thalictrum thalictroides]